MFNESSSKAATTQIILFHRITDDSARSFSRADAAQTFRVLQRLHLLTKYIIMTQEACVISKTPPNRADLGGHAHLYTLKTFGIPQSWADTVRV